MPSLAVKYRPKTFDDVCAQDYVKTILENQIVNKSFAHSYIFSGKTGAGKTTSARIFANMINGGVGTPIEIDGASNNGVDNIRSIIEDSVARSLTSIYKVYIIDEAHALTNQSWQALLKTIEEPPEYTIFIFCTTELNKIPSTIVNRCQKYEFTAIPTNIIKERLSYICTLEGFTDYEESIDYIAKSSDGSMRDAITKLEKVASYNNNFNIQDTLSILGGFPYDMWFSLTNAILSQNESMVHNIVDWCQLMSVDWRVFTSSYLSFLIDVEKYILFKDMSLIKIPRIYENDIKSITNSDSVKNYYDILIDKATEMRYNIKSDSVPEMTVRVSLLRMSRWQ